MSGRIYKKENIFGQQNHLMRIECRWCHIRKVFSFSVCIQKAVIEIQHLCAARALSLKNLSGRFHVTRHWPREAPQHPLPSIPWLVPPCSVPHFTLFCSSYHPVCSTSHCSTVCTLYCSQCHPVSWHPVPWVQFTLFNIALFSDLCTEHSTHTIPFILHTTLIQTVLHDNTTNTYNTIQHNDNK